MGGPACPDTGSRRGKDGVEEFLDLGKVHLARGQVEQALTCLAHAVDLAPGNAQAQLQYGHALDRLGRLEDAVEALHRATEIDPANVEALCSFGVALRELGRVEEAVAYFRRACALRPEDPRLARHLRSAYNRQVPEWHFRMLADEQRNEAYRRSIEAAVDSSSVVLDIGTGSGLLAMMAARAGARSVVTCEASAALAECAREVIEANGFEGRIQVVNRMSTALRVGEQLERPATVLVSEILDVGLLGEGVLPTLRHALSELVAPGAAVIPAAATLYARLVELPELRRVNPIKTIAGFDLRAFDRFRVPGVYLDIDLERAEHRALSEDFEVARFDFAAPPPAIPDDAPRRARIEVTATAAGAPHAVAAWFDLHLDETVTISTRPGGGLLTWGQAVQFLETDRTVRAGDRLAVTTLFGETWIGFELDEGGRR